VLQKSSMRQVPRSE